MELETDFINWKHLLCIAIENLNIYGYFDTYVLLYKTWIFELYAKTPIPLLMPYIFVE